jgi:hypothetical protein
MTEESRELSPVEAYLDEPVDVTTWSRQECLGCTKARRCVGLALIIPTPVYHQNEKVSLNDVSGQVLLL